MASSGFINFYEPLTNPDGPVVYVAPTAAEGVVITPDQQVIRITIPASGTGTITMPPEIEAAGRLYSFTVASDLGGEVKIQDSAGTDLVGDNLGAATDCVLLYCDGFKYFLLVDVTA